MNKNKGTPIDSISASLYSIGMGVSLDVRKRTTQVMRAVIPAILLLLPFAGCASIDPQSAPRDWPKLKIEVREVSHVEIARRCSKYAVLPVACAEVYFRTSTCVIWITPNAAKWVKDHEISHCWGNDHVGESTLRDAWAAYKEKSK